MVETLGLGRRVSAVIGGSLGGNMALRLSQGRIRAAHPWLRHLVAWSPGGVWPAFPTMKPFGGPAVGHVEGRPAEGEDANMRWKYFHATSVKDFVVTQADEWYRKDWLPCRNWFITEAILERFEIYDEAFRRWHWRIATEQLLMSHVRNEDSSNLPIEPWRTIEGPLLLLAGEEDNTSLAEIRLNTQRLAYLLNRRSGWYGPAGKHRPPRFYPGAGVPAAGPMQSSDTPATPCKPSVLGYWPHRFSASSPLLANCGGSTLAQFADL